MEDTARIMRQAAEASRVLEESNIEMLKSLQGEISKLSEAGAGAHKRSQGQFCHSDTASATHGQA